MPTRKKSAVKPLLPVTIEQGGIRYAPGMKAGRWIFATGHKGNADFAGGMSVDVMREALPAWDSSKHRRESIRYSRISGACCRGRQPLREHRARRPLLHRLSRGAAVYGARRAALGEHIRQHVDPDAALLLAGQDIEIR